MNDAGNCLSCCSRWFCPSGYRSCKRCYSTPVKTGVDVNATCSTVLWTCWKVETPLFITRKSRSSTVQFSKSLCEFLKSLSLLSGAILKSCKGCRKLVAFCSLNLRVWLQNNLQVIFLMKCNFSFQQSFKPVTLTIWIPYCRHKHEAPVQSATQLYPTANGVYSLLFAYAATKL